jgi:2-oxoglutarate dehydrogenase E1 component
LPTEGSDTVSKEFQVARLITAYRNKAHLISKTNPIRQRKDRHANLNLNFLDWTKVILIKSFTQEKFYGLAKNPFEKLLISFRKFIAEVLELSTCTSRSQQNYKWFQRLFEYGSSNFKFPIEKKKRILEKLK